MCHFRPDSRESVPPRQVQLRRRLLQLQILTILSALASWIPLGALAEAPGEAAPQAPPKSPRWTSSDFGGVLSVGLEGHRSFEKGRSLFYSSGCAKCHAFGKYGTKEARNLSEFCRTATPEEVLEGLLRSPSHRQNGRPLTDALDQAQILDLLAFLISGGNPDSPFFQGTR